MVGYSLAFVGILVSLVQGYLIRVINPKLGQNKSIYLGLFLYALGLVLFGLAWKEWMMFVFLIPYCLGGIAGPALQGLISNQVPPTEQGELQGALTSLISLTSIIGPLVMTNLFAYTTAKDSLFFLPGAPFFLAALLILISGYFAFKTLSKHRLSK
jgi:DHA1 family tetracycline resistance protein-like MFS transporter